MSKLQTNLNQIGFLDVAIIGGGVSGLYAGWRLLEEKQQLKVAIFESSERTGGRLLTLLPYGNLG